jgi:N utilization substance protein B
MNQTRKIKSSKRSITRLIAIQIFYQYHFFTGEKKLDEIKLELLENYVLKASDDISSYQNQIDKTFLDSLIFGLEINQKLIDETIIKFLQDGWDLETIDDILLAILRLGVFELKFMEDIPTKVVIGEYVDIAASFFENKKITFVNAILDAISKQISHEKKVSTSS